MKRSEMIHELAKNLRFHEQINNMSEEELIDLAITPWVDEVSMILEWCEDLGMLPPAYNNKTSGINEDYPMHKWEEE